MIKQKYKYERTEYQTTCQARLQIDIKMSFMGKNGAKIFNAERKFNISMSMQVYLSTRKTKIWLFKRRNGNKN
jgi:hypothetical protein